MTVSDSDISQSLSSPPPPLFASNGAVFSDQLNNSACADTPPGSPPGCPWDLRHQQTNVISSTSTPLKNVFSVLGKRRPLAPTSDNARPRKLHKPADAKPLTQLQMSLGQTIRTKCKNCGMEYVASSAEDRKLHDKFHKQSTEGYHVGRNFVSGTPKSQLFQGLECGDAIVELDCCQHGRRKNQGQAALEVVQTELGAVPIPKEDIWDIERQPVEGDIRYRSYLYIRETNCIGYLLAEDINEAYQVMRPDAVMPKDSDAQSITSNTPKSALEALRARKRYLEEAKAIAKQEAEDVANHPIQLCKTKRPAVMGVSRIWTSSTHRGQGIAIHLLNIAVKRCIKRLKLDEEAIQKAHVETKNSTPINSKAETSAAKLTPRSPYVKYKEQVAFSQPTDSGAKLARKWFGKAYGWSVYVDA